MNKMRNAAKVHEAEISQKPAQKGVKVKVGGLGGGGKQVVSKWGNLKKSDDDEANWKKC